MDFHFCLLCAHMHHTPTHARWSCGKVFVLSSKRTKRTNFRTDEKNQLYGSYYNTVLTTQGFMFGYPQEKDFSEELTRLWNEPQPCQYMLTLSTLIWVCLLVGCIWSTLSMQCITRVAAEVCKTCLSTQ